MMALITLGVLIITDGSVAAVALMALVTLTVTLIAQQQFPYISGHILGLNLYVTTEHKKCCK